MTAQSARAQAKPQGENGEGLDQHEVIQAFSQGK
tara:strand:- start:1 stop:102 length:102 start_codon:yes stop_codon:yes gene_type:complete